MYKTREEQLPSKGQMALCKCPEWCPIGFQVAIYDGTKFDYEDSPNYDFDLYVQEWMPLNEDGEPEFN